MSLVLTNNNTPRGGSGVPPLPPSGLTTHNAKPIVITTSARTKYVLSSSVVAATTNQQQQQPSARSATGGGAAAGSSSVVSGLTTPQRRLLDRNDLRSIRQYVSSNNMRPHQHRTGRIKDCIPDSPFEAAQDRPLDDQVHLSLAPINENESALDVPLRFAAPANLHAPAAVDAARGMGLGSRLLGTLKGAAGLQPHWDSEKVGAEKDFAHVVMVRDANMKSEAARRANDVRKYSCAQHVLGVLHYNASIFEKAVLFFRSAAELAARAEDPQWRALNENLATCCLMRLHRFKEAAALAVQTSTYCGPYGKAVCFNNAGVCHSALAAAAASSSAPGAASTSAVSKEHLSNARQCFDAALRNAGHAQDSVLDTISRGNLACAQLRLGDLVEAQSNFERCLEVCTVAGDAVGSAVILILLGETLGAAGDFKRSVFFFEQALRISNEAKCNELAKVAQTSIGITKAIGGVQARLTAPDGVAANSSVTSKDVLAALK